ncbi:hypothetical protein [Actinomadura gamaensis]|uniref:Uncharacterized protein n=1 Tax=Actinomadura gamaensis TaxID=1763541 RepID=A0ABV9TZ04_9ACTN
MPLSPPAAAQPTAETNPYLIGFKASLVKRWSHTRMRELYQELDLATYLWALDREPEALDILDSITTAIPRSSGDYNVWSPVVAMHALQARIQRARPSQPDRFAPDDRTAPNSDAPSVTTFASPNTAAVLDDPGLADNPSYIASQVTEAEAKFKAALAVRSISSSCRDLSRALCPLFVLSELAAARHPFAAYYDPTAPDRLIQQGRKALASRLTS